MLTVGEEKEEVELFRVDFDRPASLLLSISEIDITSPSSLPTIPLDARLRCLTRSE